MGLGTGGRQPPPRAFSLRYLRAFARISMLECGNDKTGGPTARHYRSHALRGNASRDALRPLVEKARVFMFFTRCVAGGVTGRGAAGDAFPRGAWERCEPQAPSAQSQTVRLVPGMTPRAGLILPVRVRFRTEPLARTGLRIGYAASVEGRPTATEGPGGWSPGGVAFRPRVGAMPPFRLKRGGTRNSSLAGSDRRLLISHARGVWRCRLDRMAGGVDR
jgi:hypothetical protein